MSKTVRLHYFQHEAFEGLAAIGEWAQNKGFSISSTHFFKGEHITILPNEIDWLVIMGGSMSVNDEKELPWLVEERKFVSEAIHAGKIVLGICLGAQMIAKALGANVYKNTQQEIGWFPLQWNVEALKQPIFQHIPKELTVLHWHGETFDLPNDSMLIASTGLTPHQGFLYKERVLGLQFHLEFNEQSTEEMLLNCGKLLQGEYVQSEESIRTQTQFIPPAKQALFGILDALLAK